MTSERLIRTVMRMKDDQLVKMGERRWFSSAKGYSFDIQVGYQATVTQIRGRTIRNYKVWP